MGEIDQEKTLLIHTKQSPKKTFLSPPPNGYSASLVSITLLSSTWKLGKRISIQRQKYIKHEKMFSYPLTKINSGD